VLHAVKAVVERMAAQIKDLPEVPKIVQCLFMRSFLPQIVFSCLAIACLFIQSASAQHNQSEHKTLSKSSLPQSEFSGMRKTGSGRVIQIIDPQTLQLQDGRLIRLTGLDFPDLSPHDAGDFALTAQKILRDMLLNQDVDIYQTKDANLGRVNRMGHHLVHLERANEGIWVQGTLLAVGLARTRTTQSNPELAEQMYALEQQARAKNTGIWEIPEFQVLPADNTDGLDDGFYIVEGRIVSAALNNNRVFLNFGKDWRTDFTVSIAPADRRRFSRAGLDPLSWNGKIVRVRGWLRHYNGPYIEIDHPQALEFVNEISDNALPDASEHPMVETQGKD
jgi:micrococcal nuclease